MNSLLISYLIVCISSLICVLIGCKLLHPKQPIFVALGYLGFIVFFLGRLYELSRIVLNLQLYNTFELGFVGIVGALSFWISTNFVIKYEIDLKPSISVIIKSLLLSLLVGLLYFIVINGTINKLERIIDLIITIFAITNVYYCMRNLLLIKEDNTNNLKKLKLFNIFSVLFSFLILLLTVSFAYSINNLLLTFSILLSFDLILMIIFFKRGVKEWK